MKNEEGSTIETILQKNANQFLSLSNITWTLGLIKNKC